MSLFSTPSRTLYAKVTFVDVDDRETVYVSKDIWDVLQSFRKSEDGEDRTTVSLTPPRFLRTAAQSTATLSKSLIAVAAYASHVCMEYHP